MKWLFQETVHQLWTWKVEIYVDLCALADYGNNNLIIWSDSKKSSKHLAIKQNWQLQNPLPMGWGYGQLKASLPVDQFQVIDTQTSPQVKITGGWMSVVELTVSSLLEVIARSHNGIKAVSTGPKGAVLAVLCVYRTFVAPV